MQTPSDPCLYVVTEENPFIIAVYVDDILLAAKGETQMLAFKQALAKQFEIKDMGELHNFFGVKVVIDKHTETVWIGQPAFSKTILFKFGMKNSNEVTAPVDTSTKLMKADEHDDYFNHTLYQPAVGSLLYLSTRT